MSFSYGMEYTVLASREVSDHLQAPSTPVASNNEKH